MNMTGAAIVLRHLYLSNSLCGRFLPLPLKNRETVYPCDEKTEELFNPKIKISLNEDIGFKLRKLIN
jgi:hypothetical protein